MELNLPAGVSTIINRYVDIPISFHKQLLETTRDVFDTLNRKFATGMVIANMGNGTWDLMPKLNELDMPLYVFNPIFNPVSLPSRMYF